MNADPPEETVLQTPPIPSETKTPSDVYVPDRASRQNDHPGRDRKGEIDVIPAASDAFGVGVRLGEIGNWEAALKYFEETVRLQPDLKWGWYNLGLAQQRTGDLDEAIKSWQRALDIDPYLVPAAVNVARTLLLQGGEDRAERFLRDRINEYPSSYELRNELAWVMISIGTPAKLDGAFAEARRVLSSDERNIGAFLVLGHVFFRQEKYELAEWVVERILGLESDNPSAHQLAAFLHLRQDRSREAFSSFEKAAQNSDENAEMYANYGALLVQSQDFDRAIEYLEKAVSYVPTMIAARLNLGNAYRGSGRYEQALAEYRRVEELDPDNKDVILNRALIYLDAPLADLDTIERLKRAQELFEDYAKKGGSDGRLADFVREVTRAIDLEERRIEREGLRSAQEAEKKRKEEREESEGTLLGEEGF